MRSDRDMINGLQVLLPSDGAVIFDMDGVLVDSAQAHYQAWRTLAMDFGIELSEEVFRTQIFGRRNHEVLESLLRRILSNNEKETLSLKKEALYRELIQEKVQGVPGCVELVRQLRDQGIPMALASSAPAANVEAVLSQFQIRDAFQTVVTAEHIKRGKPDPEVYLTTAARMGAIISHCVVFEDSPHGIDAAIRAGALTIGVATTHDTGRVRAYGAKYVIADFRSVYVSVLRQRATRPRVRFQRLPVLTVDALFRYRNEGFVLIRRRHEPFKGWLALPGGHVEVGETVEEACVREVSEETGLILGNLRPIGVYSDPRRASWHHAVTIAFCGQVLGGQPVAARDAADIVYLKDFVGTRLAFDHNQIIQDALSQGMYLAL